MQEVKFCTSFDHHYLDRGLVLFESLQKQLPGAVLQVLALSKECEEFLLRTGLKNIVVVPVSRIIEQEPRLKKAKATRSHTEFIFTLTPFIVLETLNTVEPGQHTVYLDADMMFFSSPKDFLTESNAFDVAITPHNFSRHKQDDARFGTYNVGWVGFKKTVSGQRCANWWAERCLDWCHDRLENEKFADQKYLESFDTVAGLVQKTAPIGLNCAPWNVSGRRFVLDRQNVMVDQEPLIVYHFAKVKRITQRCIATRKQLQGVVNTIGLERFVYRPYADALHRVTSKHGIPHNWIFGNTNRRHTSKYHGFHRDECPTPLQIYARFLRGEYVASTAASLLLDLCKQGTKSTSHIKVGDSDCAEPDISDKEAINITIVTPNYNQAAYLESALKSIADQKYAHLQHIVMDGGSHDGSLPIIENARESLYMYESKPDEGQYNAINRGFILSSGHVMGWLNSDDLHFPWTLSIVAEIFGAFPQIRWLTTCYPIVVDKLGRPQRCAEVFGYSRQGILRGETLPGSTGYILHGVQQESTFWHRDLWEQVGGAIDTKYSLAGDYDLWLRFARKADLYSVAVPLGAFRRHGNQKTCHYMERYCAEAMQSFKRHGLGFSNRRLRSLARNLLPESLRPLAAKFGWVYPAKILRKHKNTGEWVIHEIFA